MLSTLATRLRAAREHDGFTLVELLVAMLAGSILMAALLTMIDVTMHQTTLQFSRVDATQQGRVAVEDLEAELHSSCVAPGETPIQAGSDGSNLIFVSQYGSTSAANAITPTPVKHVVAYNAAAGTLTDSAYAVTGGTGPNWTFSTTAQSVHLILGHVTQQASSPPVFQYFSYSVPTNGGTPYTAPDGSSVEMIQDGINSVPYSASVVPAAAPLGVPLSATDAQSAVEVLIRLEAQPSGGSNLNTNQGADAVTDQVVLRLTQAINHFTTGASFGPCQ